MMKKWHKTLLGGLLILLLLPVLLYGAALVFKPRLLPVLNRKLSEKAGEKVVIRDLDFTLFADFPNLSLRLTEPRVGGIPGKEVLKAQKVAFQVQLWPLLRNSWSVNELTVNDGQVQLIRFKDGKTNFEGLTQSKGASDPGKPDHTSLIIRRLLLHNVMVQYLDEAQQKEFCATLHRVRGGMTPVDSAALVTFQGPVYFKGLTFKADQGALFANRETTLQFQWVYFPHSQRIEFRNSSFEANEQRFVVTGGFRFQEGTWIDIGIANAEVRMDKLRSLLSPTLSKAMAKYQTKDPLTARITMKGNLATGETPDMEVAWATNQMALKAFSLEFSNLTMQGNFTNHMNPERKRNDANSQVHIAPMTGRLLGTSFRAAVTINNLTDPSILIKTNAKFAKFPFPQLTKLISPEKITLENQEVSLMRKHQKKAPIPGHTQPKAIARAR